MTILGSWGLRLNTEQRHAEQLDHFFDLAKASPRAEILFSGKGDKSVGYFIEPTISLTTDPKLVTMEDEIFAPVLTLYVYQVEALDSTLRILNETSP